MTLSYKNKDYFNENIKDSLRAKSSPFTWPSKLFFYYRAGVPKAWGGDYVYAGNEFCNDDFLAPDHPRTLNP